MSEDNKETTPAVETKEETKPETTEETPKTEENKEESSSGISSFAPAPTLAAPTEEPLVTEEVEVKTHEEDEESLVKLYGLQNHLYFLLDQPQLTISSVFLLPDVQNFIEWHQNVILQSGKNVVLEKLNFFVIKKQRKLES